jgi:hypothetical protein
MRAGSDGLSHEGPAQAAPPRPIERPVRSTPRGSACGQVRRSAQKAYASRSALHRRVSATVIDDVAFPSEPSAALRASVRRHRRTPGRSLQQCQLAVDKGGLNRTVGPSSVLPPRENKKRNDDWEQSGNTPLPGSGLMFSERRSIIIARL